MLRWRLPAHNMIPTDTFIPIAERVETPEQFEFLQACDCTYAQGYLFGRAMPLAEFEAMQAAGIKMWR